MYFHVYILLYTWRYKRQLIIWIHSHKRQHQGRHQRGVGGSPPKKPNNNNIAVGLQKTEMNKGFKAPKHILLSIAACNSKSTNFLNENNLRFLATEYAIDSESLSAELMITTLILKDKTDVLANIRPTKDGFPTLWTLLQLALTFPVANTNCERLFSVLKLVKHTSEQPWDKRGWLIWEYYQLRKTLTRN